MTFNALQSFFRLKRHFSRVAPGAQSLAHKLDPDSPLPH